MQNYEIINNALLVDKPNVDIKKIIKSFYDALDKSREEIKGANLIDIKNSNGFIVDFDAISRIFSHVLEEKNVYGDVTLSVNDEDKKIIYGKQIFDTGNVVIIYDGNTYVLIEMILRNLLAFNTMIFSCDNYMCGTNQLIVQIMQTILEKNSISKYLIQYYLSDDYDILDNYANIDLVICIGNQHLQKSVLNKSKNRVIVSGYNYYNLYIEDSSYLEFLNKIIKNENNVQVYIKKDLKIDCVGAVIVDDIDEAISLINYNGTFYSSAIFTDNSLNVSKFMKMVKSKIITANTSPTIEKVLDIKQSDLVIEKTIVYPFALKKEGIK